MSNRTILAAVAASILATTSVFAQTPAVRPRPRRRRRAATIAARGGCSIG